MKQPKLTLVVDKDDIQRRKEYFVDIQGRLVPADEPLIQLGAGKSEKTMWRGAIRNLKKLLAEAEKRLEELG